MFKIIETGKAILIFFLILILCYAVFFTDTWQAYQVPGFVLAFLKMIPFYAVGICFGFHISEGKISWKLNPYFFMFLIFFLLSNYFLAVWLLEFFSLDLGKYFTIYILPVMKVYAVLAGAYFVLYLRRK